VVPSLSFPLKPFCSSLFRDRARRERGNSTPPSSLAPGRVAGREGEKGSCSSASADARARARFSPVPPPARGRLYY